MYRIGTLEQLKYEKSLQFAILLLIFFTGKLIWNWSDISGFTFILVVIEYLILTVIGFFVFKLFFSSIFANRTINKENDKRTGLEIGTSTGTLAEKNHGNGLTGGQDLKLGVEDLCQNFVCFGGIGSGKTSRFMLPMLSRLYNNDEFHAGGLVFDVKGDFYSDLQKLPKKSNFNAIRVGVGEGEKSFSLLKGLTPELASSYLNSAFYLSGNAGEAFWIDTATEVIKNSLGVLSFCENKYDLSSLNKFLFDSEFQKECMNEALKYVESTPDGGLDDRLFTNYAGYIIKNYSKLDTKMKTSVNATISQVLAPFQHPLLVDAFCDDNNINNIDLYDVLKGTTVVIDLPLATWGLGAKVVYTMIKLRFFSLVQERLVNEKLDKVTPVFFVCDEYQDVISASKHALSDLNFWDKSRSARCVGMISSQSISSFRSAVGNKETADTVLQNFRQKLCFRTEDESTIQYFQNLAGKAEVSRVSYDKDKNESVHFEERLVVDGQLIRSLSSDYALAFLNIGGSAYDDVIHMTPYYEM